MRRGKQQKDKFAQNDGGSTSPTHSPQSVFNRSLSHLPIQRKCKECEENSSLQRKTDRSFVQKKKSEATGATHTTDTVANGIESTRGTGEALPLDTKSFMETQFGADFSKVRVHNDKKSHRLSEELNAQAFTIGSDIYFNKGAFAPDSSKGKHLLAHELTHTLQQEGTIRKLPKDAFGRPLGFVPTAEQEAYDLETYRINLWNSDLERLKKGELDDRDLSNWRLMNRITGLVSTEITDLITKITEFGKKQPKLSVDKILEYLEVRKEIATPLPSGASVSKDPITNTVQSYSLTIGNVLINVLPDTFGNAGNETKVTTNFGTYNWHAGSNKIVDRLTQTSGGANTAFNPTQLIVTIQTAYMDSPNAPSAYGKGTTQYDKEEKTTTLRVHEGQHGTDYINFLQKNALPVDISKGIVGVLTVSEMKQLDAFLVKIGKDSCLLTDQIGFTQDDFLKTKEGKASGIKSCRK